MEDSWASACLAGPHKAWARSLLHTLDVCCELGPLLRSYSWWRLENECRKARWLVPCHPGGKHTLRTPQLTTP